MSSDTNKLKETLDKAFADDFDQLQVFDAIDSTNAEAIRRMQSGQEASQLIVARSQTAGRGRRGRQWLSPLDGGIYLSLTRAFDQPIMQLQGLSLVTALAVLDTLLSLKLEGVQVKWPNDLLVGGRKLAGILLETCNNATQNIIVFGIGINLALPQEVQAGLDRPATDLSRELGRAVNTTELLVELVNNWRQKLALYNSDGFQPFVDQWNQFDRYREAAIDIINGKTRTSGIGRGVDASGALLLETATGMKTINGGEVFPSVRPGEQTGVPQQ